MCYLFISNAILVIVVIIVIVFVFELRLHHKIIYKNKRSYAMPLKGIPAIISPELLYVLSSAGHGDEIGRSMHF